MRWIDYYIDQAPDGSIKVIGKTPNEVMEKGKYSLYKPGDRFVVSDDGWLVKTQDEQERNLCHNIG